MLEVRAGKIKLLLLDVDGVMTDCHITLNERGEEIKSFNVKDGLGLKLLMDAGIEVAIISGRKSSAVAHRAGELGIKDVYQGVNDKQALCRRLIRNKGYQKQVVCSVGDDLPDLAMFTESGVRVAVADAAEEVRQQADFITKNRGGSGAVREVCEWILQCQGKWSTLVKGFTGK
jgi:YrbI family 3-deoxy-D-manno-octulosonate 8-phosphate phosphatase